MLWRKRGYVILVLSIVVLVLFLGGCGKKKDVAEEGTYSGEVYPENGLPKDKKVVLNIIYPEQGYGTEYYEEGIKSFEERFPNVKINARRIDGGTAAYFQILNSLIQANDDREMYDWYYSFQNTNTIIESGKVEIQDDLWERALYDSPNLKMKDVIFTNKKDFFHSDGHLYSIPKNISIVGLFFNKGQFREMGLNTRPTDWEEFIKICIKIKAKGIHPMVMAGKFPGYFDYGWGAIPYEIGGDEFRNAQYNYEPNIYLSEAYVTMLKRMEEFARKDFFHPGTVSFDHTQSQMEFLQGKAAMITNGTWIANEMKDVVPSDFDWGFMPFPGNNKGQKQVVLSRFGPDGFIWKNKPELNKKWAKEFNLWLLNLQLQKILAKNGAMPIRNDYPLTDDMQISPSLKVAMETIREKDIQVLYNAGQTARTIQNAEMAKGSIVKRSNMIAIVTKKKTAEQAAKEMNDQYMKGLRAEKE